MARDYATVKIDAKDSLSILLHHRVTGVENLTDRILGTNLNLIVKPESRVEVTLLRRWQPPELLVRDQVYPWASQTLHLGNDVEAYPQNRTAWQHIYIEMNQPLGMQHDNINTTWKV